MQSHKISERYFLHWSARWIFKCDYYYLLRAYLTHVIVNYIYIIYLLPYYIILIIELLENKIRSWFEPWLWLRCWSQGQDLESTPGHVKDRGLYRGWVRIRDRVFKLAMGSAFGNGDKFQAWVEDRDKDDYWTQLGVKFWDWMGVMFRWPGPRLKLGTRDWNWVSISVLGFGTGLGWRTRSR